MKTKDSRRIVILGAAGFIGFHLARFLNDTCELEKAIDHLVCKLYQLTYDEVKIIDPEFELTEQEYIAIKIG